MNLQNLEAIIPGETTSRMMYLSALSKKLSDIGIQCHPISAEDLERMTVTVDTREGKRSITSDCAEDQFFIEALRRLNQPPHEPQRNGS